MNNIENTNLIDAADKPIGSPWTDQQWNAINLTGNDLLVAAAAGSGKTAVLVERIIRRISSESNPADVDRLLVATFTNAAAAEMRMRIREALEQASINKPESEHLRKQLALINRSSITTLHSFCLDVIRRYYQIIPLDPGFRIANETEAELLRQDVLAELFEDYYDKSEEDSSFWRFVDSFSGERSDDLLYHLVQRVYDYAQSNPWPEHWLNEMADVFTGFAGGSAGENPWFVSLRQDVQLELRGMIGIIEHALKLAQQPGGPIPYADNLNEDLHFISGLLACAKEQPWDQLYASFQAAGFGKLKPCKGESMDKLLQEQVKSLRDQAKKRFAAMREELFSRTSEQFDVELQLSAPLMKILVELVIEYGHRYSQAKSSRGLVDFTDLEHYCLFILRHPDSTFEHLLPSQAAIDYQEQFIEVLLDEYQDTNLVQESIVALISRSKPGNGFMVGDVKQSIYGFRLAEPRLFLAKYKSYSDDKANNDSQTSRSGIRINLARNFRSRAQIVNGVNFIFKQIMTEAAAEIEYDRNAELVCGTDYPALEEDSPTDLSIELLLIDKGSETNDNETESTESINLAQEEMLDSGEGFNSAASIQEEALELETVQLESRMIAVHIKSLMGTESGRPFLVYDKKTGGKRPVTYRDIVILLRATKQWAPLMMDELREAGIPVYAELASGYFEATEIEVVMSLLKVIDNPFQDIPLAAVLRSPMYSLSAEELAQIRIESKGIAYYEAVLAKLQAADQEQTNLHRTLRRFQTGLEGWRNAARQGALADLLWRIYRETGYYDFVGGLPGGLQRQANLRALYDRCRQYEATSFRGLFRFLRFIERMRDNGSDLGTARALGEQEDVVRIMSIHKSKGLEFPVVFVAGLSKMFNQRDLSSHFLLHKELGFGPKLVDSNLRISYPTLPNLAIKRRMRYELIAEEMRVLYVALTRPKEKLYLVATVRRLEKQAQLWAQQLECPTLSLPDYLLVKARSYMDWIGPAMIRHPDAAPLRIKAGISGVIPGLMTKDPSSWRVTLPRDDVFMNIAAAAIERGDEATLQAITQLQPLHSAGAGQLFELVSKRLSWRYPYHQATQYLSKTSVSEMKRLKEESLFVDREEGQTVFRSVATSKLLTRRPRFIENRSLTATERGTVYHAVMQHISLTDNPTADSVRTALEWMMDRQMLTSEQSEVVNPAEIVGFLSGELGLRMRASGLVRREVPFSSGLAAREVYPDAAEPVTEEIVLIQGVIDCLFMEEDGLVLIDYKTDAVTGDGDRLESSINKYRLQIDLYAKSIESIWKVPVKEKYLYFFDGMHLALM